MVCDGLCCMLGWAWSVLARRSLNLREIHCYDFISSPPSLLAEVEAAAGAGSSTIGVRVSE